MQPGPTPEGQPPDMNAILQQAQAMQEQLMSAQAQLAEMEVTGQAGNGLVTVTQTAAGEIRAVRIDRSVVDPDDVDTLQDLVVGALGDAAEKAGAAQSDAMGPLAGGLEGLGGGGDAGGGGLIGGPTTPGGAGGLPGA